MSGLGARQQSWVPFPVLLCPVPPHHTPLNPGLLLAGHQRSVETVSFSPDSKQLASGGWDKRVMLWEVQVCRTARIQRCTPSSGPRKVASPPLPCPPRCIWLQLPYQAFLHPSPGALKSSLLGLSSSPVQSQKPSPTPVLHHITQGWAWVAL